MLPHVLRRIGMLQNMLIRSCPVCAALPPTNPGARTPSQSRPLSTKPFVTVETDIKGPLPLTPEDFQYILFVQDAFSKYVELTPLRRTTTLEVSRCLSVWIGRYGIPVTVHSDQGPCNSSNGFAEFCCRFGIRHTCSTPYHPPANGSVQRLNRSLGEALAKLVSENQRDWNCISFLQLSLNTALHESTGEMP